MIKLDEEVKPRPKPATCELYNSPPSFEGRYLLQNAGEKPIQCGDFNVLRERSWLYYLSAQALDEFDMFTESAGWRLTGEAVNYLVQHGYVVEIVTLEMRAERKAKYKAELEEKFRAEQFAKSRADLDYQRHVNEFEDALMVTWREQSQGEYEGDRITLIQNAVRDHSYVTYSLLKSDATRIFKHVVMDMDCWNSYVSVESPRNLAELQRLMEEAKRKREDEIRLRQEAHQNKLFTELRCAKCGRLVYLESEKAKVVTKYCGKHGANTSAECRRVGAVFEKTLELKRREIPAEAEVIYY